MTFETTIEGIPARVEVKHDSDRYSVRILGTDDSLGRQFASIEQAESAVKRYNLSQRARGSSTRSHSAGAMSR